MLRLLRASLPVTTAVVTATLATVAVVFLGSPPPVIPVPDPLVRIETRSGDIKKVTYVPVGGVAVPIDVDGSGVGVPDIEVAVPALDASNGVENLLSPGLVVKRSAVAVAAGQASPPLELKATIELLDAGSGLAPLASIDAGFSVPVGGGIPPTLDGRLRGVLSGGLDEGLHLDVKTPGYRGPLDVAFAVRRGDQELDADLRFRAMPQTLTATQRTTDDGLTLGVDHDGTDVALDLDVDRRDGDERVRLQAELDRLPRDLDLTANLGDAPNVDVRHASSEADPDLRATLRSTLADVPVFEADLELEGVPSTVQAAFRRTVDGEVDGASFASAAGQDLDVASFRAAPGVLAGASSTPERGAAPHVGLTSGERSAVVGRLERVRSVQLSRSGAGVDLDAEVGDGVEPLLVDLDVQGDRSIRAAARVAPLPARAELGLEARGDGLTVRYDADRTTDIELDGRTWTGASEQCGTDGVTCVDGTLTDLPSAFTAALAGDDADRLATLEHDGSGRPSVAVDLDHNPVGAARTWARLAVDGVPRATRVGVRRDAAGAVTGMDLSACREDDACADDERLDRVEVLVRPAPTRADLPEAPDLGAGGVAFLGRDDGYEARALVRDLRGLAVAQRNPHDGGGGTVGGELRVRGERPFVIEVDDDRDGVARTATAAVDALPERFAACLRLPADGRRGDTPGDPLLDGCEQGTGLDAGDAEPLSVAYEASNSAAVRTAVRVERGGGPEDDGRRRVLAAEATVDAIPETVAFDVLADEDEEQPVRFAYRASDAVDQIDLAFENRRADDRCGDPRPGRSALCGSLRLTDLPSAIEGHVEPTDERTLVELRTEGAETPASLERLEVTSVKPDPETSPLVLRGAIRDLPAAVTARLLNADTDGDGDLDPVDVEVDACPDGTNDCAGVGRVELEASNQLADDLLRTAVTDADEAIEIAGRGTQFRVGVRMNDVRRAAFSSLDENGEAAPTASLEFAFADEAAHDVRTSLDVEQTGSTTRLDATARHLRGELRACLRGPLPDGESADEDSASWCARQQADRSVLQAELPGDATGTRPDLLVEELAVQRTGAPDLAAEVRVLELAERIELGIGQTGDVAVQGTDDDGQVSTAAGRVGFDIRLGDGGTGEAYPYRPREEDIVEPQDDPRNVVGSGRDRQLNHVTVGLDGRRGLRLHGSVPDIARLATTGAPCESDDTRYPVGRGGVEPRCFEVRAADDEPLGFALRSRDADGQILTVEEGHVSAVPREGLRMTIAPPAGGQADQPACGPRVTSTCVPPLLSVVSGRDDGDRPTLTARLAAGDPSRLDRLKATVPLDDASALIAFEESPRAYDATGVRAKIAAEDEGLAIRAGLALEIPRFVDIDMPRLSSCVHDTPTPTSCSARGVGPAENRGYQSADLELRFALADASRGAGDVARLGRVAVLAQEAESRQVVLTGVSAPDDTTPLGATRVVGASSEGAEKLPSAGSPEVLGANLPGQVDLRLALRQDHNAVEGGRPAQLYAQLDGRVNRPLDAAVRILEGTATGRNGNVVAPIALRLLRAPGANGPVTGSDPTFRVRAELRTPYVAEDPAARFDCDGDAKGFDIAGAFVACVQLPLGARAEWLDVLLNPDPVSDGTTTTSDAARTVDVVVGPLGLESELEVRGFASVNGSGGSVGKGAAGAATVQATSLIEDFDFGARVGGAFRVGGELDWRNRSDVLLGGAVGLSERFTIGTYGAHITADSSGGTPVLETDARSQVSVRLTGSLLFGLVETELLSKTSDVFDQPVGFHDCRTKARRSETDRVRTNPLDVAVLLEDPPFTGTGQKLVNAISGAILPIFCAVDASSDAKVDAQHPAPSYATGGRTVSDLPAVAIAGPVTTPAAGTRGEREDVTITGTELACGVLVAARLRVRSGGTLRAGSPGTTAADGTACDGTLVIDAETVDVDAGGVITASGAAGADAGAGTPSGRGGGAGHHRDGGDAGGSAGVGGSAYDRPNGGLLSDLGSVGAIGSGGAAAGRGGGVLAVYASGDVTVDGRIVANGAIGSAVAASGSCTSVGAGGGSGGSIQLIGARLKGTGSVEVAGGDGGDGDRAGGGGAGGRLVADTTSKASTLAFDDDAGRGGNRTDTGSGCGGGSRGGDGDTTLEDRDAIATVEAVDVEDAATVGDDEVRVRVKAIADPPASGRLAIVLCRRDAAASEAGDLFSAPVDPTSTIALTAVNEADTCRQVAFSAPTSGTDEYRDTITLTGLPEGHHGWFAVAADIATAGDCSRFPELCTFMSQAPGSAQLRLTTDTEAPTGTLTAVSGLEDCAGIARCLPTGENAIVELQATDTLSDIADIRCRVDGGGWRLDCGVGRSTVRIGESTGVKQVEARIRDAAGNERIVGPAEFLREKEAPSTPTITVSGPGEVNGWYPGVPDVSVATTDPLPTSGLDEDHVTVRAGASDVFCGSPSPSRVSGSPASGGCTPSELSTILPGDGEIELTATAADRHGNVSDESAAVTLRVDETPPTSRAIVAPAAPDGEDGWYVTAPVLGFSAVDTSGSGVDPTEDTDDVGTGIRWSLNGGSFTAYDPSDEDTNTLPDGRHRVCWYATDVAGNREANGAPFLTAPDTNCRTLKVDTTAPVLADRITPVTPDGTGGFHVTAPVLEATAGDRDGAASAADRSGSPTVELRRDLGSWNAGPSVSAPAGEHRLAARATDAAGNVSAVTQHRVTVDADDPTVRARTAPERPGSTGWFRRTPVIRVAGGDAKPGSGAAEVRVGVDGGTPTAVTADLPVADGRHTARVRTRDIASRSSAEAILEPEVDRTGPVAEALSASTRTLVAGQNTELRVRASDDHSGGVTASIELVELLSGSRRTLTVPGELGASPKTVTWDGKADGGTPLAGTWVWRVVATDRAGNTSVSAEGPVVLTVLTAPTTSTATGGTPSAVTSTVSGALKGLTKTVKRLLSL